MTSFSTAICRWILILLAINICTFVYIFNYLNIQLDPINQHHLSDSLFLNQSNKTLLVEIWSKSAIGQYLWENILNGRTEAKIFPNNFYIEGRKQIGAVTFHFRSGPALKPESLASFEVDNLILILNWRSTEKINYSLKWLNVIINDTKYRQVIKNLGLIALGNEHCNNSWFIDKYLTKNFRFLFITYDWTKVNNRNIFQWPLGLATYRNFPVLNHSSQLMTEILQWERNYTCNFIATVYNNSTRRELQQLFDQQPSLRAKCFIKTRPNWRSDEDEDSMLTYVQALQSSDLTLSPIGKNHECYRILEAVEYGSIPVLEENYYHLTNDHCHECDRNNVYRLFKEFDAPFIYVSNWTKELSIILNQWHSKSFNDKKRHRIKLLKWYHKFKIQLKNRLVNVIQNKFQYF